MELDESYVLRPAGLTTDRQRLRLRIEQNDLGIPLRVFQKVGDAEHELAGVTGIKLLGQPKLMHVQISAIADIELVTIETPPSVA